MNNQQLPERDFRFDRREFAGSLGDLGTFIPLLVGMVKTCGLQLCPTLLLSGIANIITGWLFRIPMPIQPMKAIAAVAIAEGLTESQILTAGILTGGVVFIFGISGLIDWINKAIPKSVIRGLQLALGIKLFIAGTNMIISTHAWVGWDSAVLALVCGVVILSEKLTSQLPRALIVFTIGVIALLLSNPDLLTAPRLGLSWHWPDLGQRSDWLKGFWAGALPQIPLTTLNSVVSVCALSADLFPRKYAQPKRVAMSVGLFNLAICPLGGMPVCHGAGGLAAQYRFGARTGGSVVMLGLCKIGLVLWLGGSLLAWLTHFPQSVLGVMLMFSGFELAKVCRDQRLRTDITVMLTTAAVCILLSTSVGFAVGLLFSVLLMKVWTQTRGRSSDNNHQAG